MRAKLALEDGTVFEGASFGAAGERTGEVVFNTAMTGYQEILTDPSYKGQMVAMTYPLIGNYGLNSEDAESDKVHMEAFIVKEKSAISSNWRSEEGLGEYLKKYNVMGLEGIDTRALTRHIRLQGAMKAVISTEDMNDKSLAKKAAGSQGLEGVDMVKHVTCKKPYEWSKKGRYKVVVIDCGVKYNILRELEKQDCRVYVVPAATSAEEILKMKPDGIMLSNGPGDPAAVPYVAETVRKIIHHSPLTTHQLPIMGICLGQQILCLVLGGRTFKLKFGHHGANHPVKDLRTKKISITVQNHGFCADIDSLNKKEVEITHVNLNDQTLEGIRHKKMPLFSVQFHPEASPGPNDAKYLFKEFAGMMKRIKL